MRLSLRYARAGVSGGARPRKSDATRPICRTGAAIRNSKEAPSGATIRKGAVAGPCSGSSNELDGAALWIWLLSSDEVCGAEAAEMSANRRRSSLAEMTGNSATAAMNTEMARCSRSARYALAAPRVSPQHS